MIEEIKKKRKKDPYWGKPYANLMRKTFSEIFLTSNQGKKLLPNDSMKKTFKNKLIYLKYLLTSDELDDDYREEEWFSSRRLTWGYNIYNNQRNLNSGLCSKDCYEYIINGKGSKLVQDHFFGVTLSAEEVRKAFEESNFDIDYMVNEWLPKKYYMFIKWYVTPEEHKKENILRGEHTLEQKDNFEHLINCSEPVEKKRKTQLLKEKY